MHFEVESLIEHPASVVIETMIERMEELVQFMPSVESIETVSVERSSDGRVHVVRRWQGTTRSAPLAVRPFMSKETLAWIDDAWWSPDQYKVDWTHSGKSGAVYTLSGTNFFEPHPDDPVHATRARLTGDLVVHADRLPVPAVLGNRLAPQIERFVVNLLTPNLADTGAGLKSYLDDSVPKTGTDV